MSAGRVCVKARVWMRRDHGARVCGGVGESF